MDDYYTAWEIGGAIDDPLRRRPSHPMGAWRQASRRHRGSVVSRPGPRGPTRTVRRPGRGSSIGTGTSAAMRLGGRPRLAARLRLPWPRTGRPTTRSCRPSTALPLRTPHEICTIRRRRGRIHRVRVRVRAGAPPPAGCMDHHVAAPAVTVKRWARRNRSLTSSGECRVEYRAISRSVSSAQAPSTRPTGIIVDDLDPRRPEPAKIADANRQK